MHLKSMKLIFALAISGIVLLGTSARGDDFSFSFTNTIGSAPGTVTGEILGLTNNTTGAAQEVIITSAPSEYDTMISLGTVADAAWIFQWDNTFTETNGEITFANFYSQGVIGWPQGILTMGSGQLSLLTPDYLGTSSGVLFWCGPGNAWCLSSEGVGTLTFQSLSPAPVPEPSTYGLTLIGLGLLGLMPKQKHGHPSPITRDTHITPAHHA